MKAPLSCFLVLVLAIVAHGATHPTPPSARFTAKEIAQGYREHVILARPRAAVRATIDTDEAREGIHVQRTFSRFGGLRVIQLDASDNAAAAIARLRATGRYDFVEPDYLRHVEVTPNDPKMLDGSLWAFQNTGQFGSVQGIAGDDIEAPAAWDIIHDASNVIVAVVDTGINLNHQDITDPSSGISNLWTNPNPTRNDLHGANYVGGNGGLVSGNPSDDEGHGTHVAGIIGAIGSNGIAGTGVAWKVQLMAVKVLGSDGTGTSTDIVGGINYAIDHGANIINASFGADSASGFSNAELLAVATARANGIIFVAAAGNSNANLDVARSYPASYALDNIVTVGSSNRRDEVSSFSNYGAAVDLFAPGEEIVSLDYSSTTGTISFSGTSMAAPEVSGALALLKAHFPTDNYRQLINRLLRGAKAGANFANKSQTGGRLDLLRALTTTTNTPFNDAFADRPHFNTDNLTIRANNVGATAEPGEPAIAGAPATSTLWWEWTAPASGTVSVDTNGSAYDTVLGVYTGSAVSALTPVASNDNAGGGVTSRVTFTAQAGATYEIGVDGKYGATGLTLLNVGTTPANDAFASPVVLSGQSTHVTATNLHCSREPGEPAIFAEYAGGNSLWYQWTAPRKGHFQVAVTSNDFDPIMAVYTGSSLGTLSLVTRGDNTGANSSNTAALCSIDATAGTTYLITVDSKTASEVGQFVLGLVDSQWQATTDNGITGAPAVASDGTVYVGSTDKSLYAFSPDGSQKWTYATGGSIDTCSPAIADDGTVYVGSADGFLYALNPTGTLKWKHSFNGTTPVGAGCSPALAADGTIYLRATDGYLHALSPTDGSERWKANIHSLATGFYGNPVIGADGTIYQGSDETDHNLYAFNPDGSVKWMFALGANEGVYGAPAIDADGNLYIVTLNGTAYSISPSGAKRWSVASGGNVSSSVALSGDGRTMYYAGYDAKLYALNTATGAQRWTYGLGAEVRASSPAIDSSGVIYIGDYDGKLYAVNADGTLNRTYDTANWIRSAPVIAGSRLYVGSNDQKLYAFNLSADVAVGPWSQYRANARRLGRYVSEGLAIAAQPQSQTAVLSLPLTLSVTATGQGPYTYQWYKDGAPIRDGTGSSYTVASVANADAGSYTVTVANGKDTVTSSAAVISVEPLNPGHLINLSVRTTAGTGDQTLIVGFTISGSGPKSLLIRGVGPSLNVPPFNLSGAINAAQLQVLTFPAGTVIASNAAWDSSLATTFNSVGAFPLVTGSKDDALVSTFTPALYTAKVTSADGSTGTAMAEIYDTAPSNTSASSWLSNISARAQVGTGGNVLIAGFVISGNAPKQVLIRGIGPGIAAYVSGAIADPKVEVYDSKSQLVTSNDNWGGTDTLMSAFQKVSAFGLSTTSKDAALLVTLKPGLYTAIVSGVNGTTGVGLVEVYEMP